MKKKYIVIAALAVILIMALVTTILLVNKYRFAINKDSSKWDTKIEILESRRIQPLAKNTIIFIGSSSIRHWKTLAEDMAPLPVANHGFGGSRILDSAHYARRLVTQFNPSMVVLYAGDNDVYLRDLFGAKGDTPKKCLADFKSFVQAIRRESLQIQVYFLAIKHSIKRERYWPQMKQANDLIARHCQTDGKLTFIDISQALVSPDGQGNSDYFVDGLHLNKKGYDRWTSIIKPILEKDYMALVESAQ